MHVQESKFGRKINKFGGKSFKKLNSTEFMEFVFTKSGYFLYLDPLDTAPSSVTKFDNGCYHVAITSNTRISQSKNIKEPELFE